MKYLLLCTLWIIWCFLHSYLISTRTTTWFKKRLDNKFAFYRIFYNLFSLITVLPLLYWQRGIPGPIIIEFSPFLLFFKYLTLISGIVLIAGASFTFDIREFLGTRQISSRFQRIQSKLSYESQQPIITKHGFYGIARHPMYLGGFVCFIALMMHAPLAQFLGYFILAVYMTIGTVREDGRLARELGDVYRNYQKEVPLLLPKILGKRSCPKN